MKIRLSSNVWALAWPMMLSNISIPLLGIVDIAMVGHLPQPNAIATVALGTMIFDILFWCFGFLRMSTTALASQEPDSHHIYYQSILIALIIALLLIGFRADIKKGTLLFVHTDDGVKKMLASYVSIRIFAAIPTFINYVNYGFLFGRHDTKTPLALILVANTCAVILDYIFVWHLGLGADGIAYANLITQTLSAVLGIGVIYKRYLAKAAPINLNLLFSLQRSTQLFSLNTDIFIRTILLVITTSFFTRQSAYLGVDIVAANVILMNMQLCTSFALDGFAIAAETLVGRAVGNNDTRDFYRQINDCAHWSGVFALTITCAYFLFGPLLISFMTSLAAVKRIAMHSLLWVVCLPLLSMPGFLLDGIFIGAADSKPLRNSMVFATLFVFIPTWYLSQALANQGLWLAYTCFMLARGAYLSVVLTHRYKSR